MSPNDNDSGRLLSVDQELLNLPVRRTIHRRSSGRLADPVPDDRHFRPAALRRLPNDDRLDVTDMAPSPKIVP